MSIPFEGFLDLSVEELGGIASLLDVDLPGYVLAIDEPPGVSQIQVLADIGRRALLSRGIVQAEAGQLKMDSGILQAMQVACRPNLAMLAISAGETVSCNWLLCGNGLAIVATAVGEGIFRHRATPIDRVGDVLRHLLPTADVAQPSSTPMLPPSALASLKPHLAGSGVDMVDLPNEHLEGLVVNGLVSSSNDESPPLGHHSVWWLSGPNNVQLLVDNAGAIELQPCSSKEVWDRCAAVVLKQEYA